MQVHYDTAFWEPSIYYIPNMKMKKNASTCSCGEEHPEDSEKGLSRAVIWQSVVL